MSRRGWKQPSLLAPKYEIRALKNSQLTSGKTPRISGTGHYTATLPVNLRAWLR